MDSNGPKFHVGARVEPDLAQRFALAARREGRTFSHELRLAMMQRLETLSGERPAALDTSEAEAVGASR